MRNTAGMVPFDVNVPNVARIYDYVLGGKDNYAADRKVADELLEVMPDVVAACRENRRFLRRAVRYLAGEAGIRQFIDIGSGLPTAENTHQIAASVRPEARVVYADYDQVVVGHARALLAGTNPQVAVVQGDLRDPGGILSDKVLLQLIDFDRPVAILLVAILHFIRDEENPERIVRLLRQVMAPGSHLVISHVTDDSVSRQEQQAGVAVYERASAPIIPRTYDQVRAFFDGLELVEPGLVSIARWRQAGASPGRSLIYGGMGRKG
jgi:SAM-dependent methyltransferase